jgi:List-Bact-rpt repeat protein
MKRLLSMLILGFSMAMLLGDCGGGGGGGNGSVPATYNDLVGVWTTNNDGFYYGDNGCGCGLAGAAGTFTIESQSGNAITLMDTNGNPVAATLSGNQISWSAPLIPANALTCADPGPETITITLSADNAGTAMTTATCYGEGTGPYTSTLGGTVTKASNGFLTVTYNGNGNTGGSPPADSNLYDPSQQVTVLGTGSLVKTGDNFSGWNTKADGSGTTYTQGQSFAMGSTDVTLYAIWTIQPTYTVTYNGNGIVSCTAPTDGTHYVTNQTVTVKGYSCNLIKTGYLLTDWNTQANGSGTSYTVGQTFPMGSADVTLYAINTPVKLVFLTKNTGGFTSNPPVGAAGGDAGCLSYASSAGLTGNWMAWLSDATTSPSTRFTQSAVPYVTLDGTVIANNWAQLTSGTLQNAIMHDENGAAVAASYVWTGTNVNGAAIIGISGNDCNNWTTSTSSYTAAVGYSSNSNSLWTSDITYGCQNTNVRLYCFQQ